MLMKLNPILALLLTHDLLLARRGVALPATHGLNAAISRHKARLSAELTRARLRRGFATIEAFREHVNSEAISGQQSAQDGKEPSRHPRWIRINTLKTTMDEELKYGTFSNFTTVSSLKQIIQASSDSRLVYVDEHIPNLIAVASPEDPTTFKAYKAGKLILQEKASCFPAYLLDPTPGDGNIIDACAAPGNKTTHIAAIVADASKVTACERNPERSKTLAKMVKLAGAEKIVTIREKQDFTKLDVTNPKFANVTALILDPSCSGSGIFGRDEANVTVHLPSTTTEEPTTPKGKKRKRGAQPAKAQPNPEKEEEEEGTAIVEETPDNEDNAEKLSTRLQNLSSFQLRIIQHAMSFPAAKRITYSTCSLHAQENEHVVVSALLSNIASAKGWRVLRRDEQVDGMRWWHKRGGKEAVEFALGIVDSEVEGGRGIDAEMVAEACIKCDKGGEDGTMGFFVVAFVRDEKLAESGRKVGHLDSQASLEEGSNSSESDSEEEWGGFSEDDE